MFIRQFKKDDLPQMCEIWNEVVSDGIAFPQEDLLDLDSGHEFFKSQTMTSVAVEDDNIIGLYILHPNNVGRCGHIANASYAVSSDARGHGIGEELVRDSMKQAKNQGFKILQFNAVVKTNPARHLYERLGFKQIGVIPKGFRLKNGEYVDICPYYIEL